MAAPVWHHGMDNPSSIHQPAAQGVAATAGIPLYVRVAESLRARVLAGEWAKGHQLPTIDSLAETYGVAQITASKAVQRLVGEGILSSARGRGTHVLKSPQVTVPSPGLRSAINDPRVLAPEHVIRILSRRTVSTLPAELQQNYRLAKQYVHVHKIHDFRSTPFALMDIYVDRNVYSRFPKGADRTSKLSFLLREHGNVKIAASRQELTVTHATQPAAEMLGCQIAAPLVRVRRWRTDAKGVVVYACIVLYRSDLFAWDVTEAHPGADHYADHLVPEAHLPG
jgi:GntR family transcriptional regulator